MGKLKVFLIFLVLGLVFYFYWHNKLNSKKFSSIPSPPKNIEIITPSETKNIKSEIITEQKKPPQSQPKSKTKRFTEAEKTEYLQKIRDTIKDQWMELEDCENEFDMQFGELLSMDDKKIIEYLKDPNNLDNFLDKISSFNMTTPTSAKMIKELAEPIANEVEGNQIIKTVGFVKLCRDGEKEKLIRILHNLQIKNQRTALAGVSFFENENSTLTYPSILSKRLFDIRLFIQGYGMKETDFPELGKLVNDLNKYFMRQYKESKNSPMEEGVIFNYKTQKEDYEYAIKLQKQINFLLQKIKRSFI